MDTDPQVYRYIFTGYMKDIEGEIEKELADNIKQRGGFFTGMDASSVLCVCTYKGSLVEPAFVAEVTYVIEFPIRFLFSDETITLEMSEKSESPIVDMGDFIGTIDMLEDYYQNTGAEEKVNNKISGIKNKINEFFGK